MTPNTIALIASQFRRLQIDFKQPIAGKNLIATAVAVEETLRPYEQALASLGLTKPEFEESRDALTAEKEHAKRMIEFGAAALHLLESSASNPPASAAKPQAPTPKPAPSAPTPAKPQAPTPKPAPSAPTPAKPQRKPKTLTEQCIGARADSVISHASEVQQRAIAADGSTSWTERARKAKSLK